MPRRYNRRKRPYKRRRFNRRRNFRKGRVSKRYVYKAIDKNIEKKYLVRDQTSTGFISHLNPTTPVVHTLLSTSQGTTDLGHRVGDRIKIRSLRIRMLIRVNQASGAGYNYYNTGLTQNARVVIIQFKTATNTIAGLAFRDCFMTNSVSGIGTEWNTMSVYDHDRRKEFRVLYDKIHNISSDTHQKKYIKIFIKKFWTRQIQYEGGGSSPRFGEIMLGVTSDVFPDVGMTEYPKMFYLSKVNYKDA